VPEDFQAAVFAKPQFEEQGCGGPPAGRFHSVYSAEYCELKAMPLSMRDEVRHLIGDEAESWVGLYPPRLSCGTSISNR
jgi:hypothetical protein